MYFLPFRHRLRLVVSILTVVLCNATGIAQTLALEKVITLPAGQYPLEDLLNRLRQQTNAGFSYSPDAVPLQQAIALPGVPHTLGSVLEAIRRQTGLSYTLRQQQVVLYREGSSGRQGAPRHTVSGYVREAGSSELLVGATVYVPALRVGVTTNNYGFYSLTLPAADSIRIGFSYVGYAAAWPVLSLHSDQVLNVSLRTAGQLETVTVTGQESVQESSTPQMGTVEVPAALIGNAPALAGEKDVMKVLLMLPGVQKGREGTGTLNVRGGGSDQNLIILDDAVVYNAYHGFGFLSLFNGDALKSVTFTRGGFPARYGGRLSSVVEMTMKEGNKEQFHGKAGLGLLSAHATFEGPIRKGKSSFLISGRRSYADALTRPVFGGGFHFYDLNVKLNHDFGLKDKLYLSGYFGKDRFSYRERFNGYTSRAGFNWGNATGTLRWNHLFSEKVFANAAFVASHYRFLVRSREENPGGRYELSYASQIRDLGVKYDLDYFPAPKHTVRVGMSSTWHYFTPHALVVRDDQVDDNRREETSIEGIESGVYLEDTYRPWSWASLGAGLRFNHYYTRGRSYQNLEPRLSAALHAGPLTALKASYTQMNQYVHLISNTNLGLPTDQWVLATRRVPPQQSEQVAAGITRDFPEKGVSLTVEGYSKRSRRVLSYKEGATFLDILNDPSATSGTGWEDKVTTGRGWSYGLEWLLQKKQGRLSGWIGYTLSWSWQQFDSLNGGRTFYARFDRRHDLSVVGVYRLKDHVTLSASWVVATGTPFTPPQAVYEAPDPSGGGTSRAVIDYGERNSIRTPVFHRLDVGVQFHKKKRWGERTWEISVYNLYNRLNPFYYQPDYRLTSAGPADPTSGQPTKWVVDNQGIKSFAIFPILPSVSYHATF